jgi:hypothetical protein
MAKSCGQFQLRGSRHGMMQFAALIESYSNGSCNI